MLLAAKPLLILLPLFIAQYVLAIFALTRLALCRFKAGRYCAWNLVIMFVFFVGAISFLVYYYAVRKKQVIREEEQDTAAQKVDNTDGERYNTDDTTNK